jgi:SAM-dependent methyltransferase
MSSGRPPSPATTKSDAHAVDPWSAAYLRFETPEQEIRKFQHRLRRVGQSAWPRDARIVELFCGRGGGMHALERFGFKHLHGIDLSWLLASHYQGAATVTVADCRDIPVASGSVDIAIVQGGLHHLLSLPDDLERTVAEVARILVPRGRFVAVEPWRTPFLDAVHWISERKLARRMWSKFDAFATMTEYELETYTAWLNQPALVIGILRRYFPDSSAHVAMGKLTFVGSRR